MSKFRNPEFVKRYDYTYYDLATPLRDVVANNSRQEKINYRFEVDNSSEANPLDWCNAYMEVDFKLVTTADSSAEITAGIDNANKFCTTTNFVQLQMFKRLSNNWKLYVME